MSTRANVTSIVAAGGVVAAGWYGGTAHGQTRDLADPAPSSSSTTAPSTPGSTGSSSSSSAPNASGAKTYTGTTVRHHYGTVTVTATVSGGKVTAITETVVSDGERKSESINARAIPTIRARVLAAGSANVSTVSGATYTTQAYLQSLQSALDQAK